MEKARSVCSFDLVNKLNTDVKMFNDKLSGIEKEMNEAVQNIEFNKEVVAMDVSSFEPEAITVLQKHCIKMIVTVVGNDRNGNFVADDDDLFNYQFCDHCGKFHYDEEC